MSDKSEKLEAQLGSIQQQLLKWKVELNDFQKWDLDNNGILDDTEKAALNSRKAELAQILKRLKNIAKLKGLNLPLVALDVKDSNTVIPKKGFAETVEEIIANYKEAILELKNDESISIIKIQIGYNWESKFIFSTHNDKIITDLKADFLKVLNKSGAKTMGELADLLIEMLGTYNKDYIAKYYGKEYKGKAITPEIIKGMFPDAAKLKKAIESGIDKTDPRHPDAKAAEEAKKEKLEANISEFNRQYAAWLEKSKEVPAKIISQISGTEANSQLKKQKIIRVFLNVADGWKNHQPDLSIEIIDKILSKVKAVERDTIAVKVIADAMRDALLNIETPKLNIFKEWDKHKIFPNFYDLQSCVTTSTEDDYSQKLLDFYMEWFQKNGSVLDRLQLERKFPSTQLFKINDLLSNLKSIFNEDHNSFFYPVLEKNIKETGVINSSLEKLNQAWKASLMEVIVTSNNIDNYYKKLPKEDTTVLKQKILNVETLMETMAGSDTIKIAFLNALYIAPVLPQIASGETLSFDIVLNDGTILRNTVFTKIVRDKSYYAEAISVSVTPTSGKRGFSFQEVKDFTTTDAITSGDTVSCYFEYKIPFTKDKGSQSKAVENSRVLSYETVIGNSETDVNMSNFNLEKSLGLGGQLGPIDVENTTTIGGGKIWGREKTNYYELVLGRSYEQSESNARNTELGENSGFFHIKLSLMTTGQDEATIDVILSAEPDWISSPDSKGFSTKKPDDVKKVMRWKK